MSSVPPIRPPDDDGEWHVLEAAVSVAYVALTDARALHDRLAPPRRAGDGLTLDLGQALGIILTMLDAYMDAPPRRPS